MLSVVSDTVIILSVVLGIEILMVIAILYYVDGDIDIGDYCGCEYDCVCVLMRVVGLYY